MSRPAVGFILGKQGPQEWWGGASGAPCQPDLERVGFAPAGDKDAPQARARALGPGGCSSSREPVG